MKKILIILSIFCLSLSFSTELEAQCPMCRMSAESNLKNGGTAGRGLNAGILYMLAMPYLLVGVLGYVYYRHKKSEEHDDILEFSEISEIDPAQLN